MMQILKLDNMNLRLNCENYIRNLQEKKNKQVKRWEFLEDYENHQKDNNEKPRTEKKKKKT